MAGSGYLPERQTGPVGEDEHADPFVVVGAPPGIIESVSDTEGQLGSVLPMKVPEHLSPLPQKLSEYRATQAKRMRVRRIVPILEAERGLHFSNRRRDPGMHVVVIAQPLLMQAYATTPAEVRRHEIREILKRRLSSFLLPPFVVVTAGGDPHIVRLTLKKRVVEERDTFGEPWLVRDPPRYGHRFKADDPERPRRWHFASPRAVGEHHNLDTQGRRWVRYERERFSTLIHRLGL